MSVREVVAVRTASRAVRVGPGSGRSVQLGKNAGRVVKARGDAARVFRVPPGAGRGRVVRQGVPGPAGPPGPAGASHLHTQTVPASAWVVNHNLGFAPAVEVRGNAGTVVSAGVTHLSLDTTRIEFNPAFAGSARFS